MFKLIYNSIAFSILLIQLVSLAILFVLYGISENADTLLFSISVVGSIQLIEIMFIEQFMFFYHKLLLKNQQDAENFYYFAFTLSLGVGIIIFSLLMILLTVYPELLSLGLTGKRFDLYLNLLYIMNFGLMAYPILAINDRLLNAKGYFGASYILASSMHIFLFLSLIIVFIIPKLSIVFLGFGYTFGIIVGAIVSTIFIIQKFSYKIKLTFSHEIAKAFIIKSIGMRFGHNIFMVLFYPITNFFLTQLPNGSISIFYYVYRGVIAIFSVTVGPSFKMYMSRISLLWAKKKFNLIRLFSTKYTRTVLWIYIIAIICVYLLLEFIFPMIIKVFNINLSLTNLFIIKLLYILISLWQLIVIYESKYIGIITVSQNSKQFISINLLFILLYTTACYIFIDYMDIYALGIAAIIAQIVSLLFYSFFANKILKKNI